MPLLGIDGHIEETILRCPSAQKASQAFADLLKRAGKNRSELDRLSNPHLVEVAVFCGGFVIPREAVDLPIVIAVKGENCNT